MTHPLSFADISFFSTEISKVCYIEKYRYRFYFDTLFLFLLTFFEYLKICLINMVTVLMVLAKIATLGLFKIKIFWNKVYEVIISVHSVINKKYQVTQIIPQMWSCNQTLVTLASTSMRDVIITSILYRFDQKKHFLQGWSWFKSNDMGLALGMALEF